MEDSFLVIGHPRCGTGYMAKLLCSFGIDVAYAPLVPVSRVGFIVLLGQVEDRPWVVDGKLCVRPLLTGSATFDHRPLGFRTADSD